MSTRYWIEVLLIVSVLLLVGLCFFCYAIKRAGQQDPQLREFAVACAAVCALGLATTSMGMIMVSVPLGP